MKRISSFLGFAALAVLLIVGTPSLWADSQRLLSVNDISASSPNQITLDSVRSDGAGWLVIYNMTDDRKPGDVIGYAPLHDGLNFNVAVNFDASAATPDMFVVLYSDKGGSGKFDPATASPVLESDGSWAMARFSYTYNPIPNTP
jgi:hypothetical protein